MVDKIADLAVVVLVAVTVGGDMNVPALEVAAEILAAVAVFLFVQSTTAHH